MKNCELCNILNNICTKVYKKCLDIDDPFIIVNCKTCKVPMVVFINHKEPKINAFKYSISVVREMFPNKKIDLTRKKTCRHPHFHIREL